MGRFGKRRDGTAQARETKHQTFRTFYLFPSCLPTPHPNLHLTSHPPALAPPDACLPRKCCEYSLAGTAMPSKLSSFLMPFPPPCSSPTPISTPSKQPHLLPRRSMVGIFMYFSRGARLALPSKKRTQGKEIKRLVAGWWLVEVSGGQDVVLVGLTWALLSGSNQHLYVPSSRQILNARPSLPPDESVICQGKSTFDQS